ncbi:hypothetical protein [Hyperthermus butylicus]|uniref:Uncharacterized protein n=1 Tax=Hyperthermus butylicus (strain DSM 5456 / JCM 9403 / PLM1-5) TaxID=415426 RepID=A2BMF7_HYPBU|nr:hypothetical protein [Hyperthermus butylicus]ABM81168.1 hypothetical protein Hbut_1339 [Hyperthermus butylicus DSM 5456]
MHTPGYPIPGSPVEALGDTMPTVYKPKATAARPGAGDALSTLPRLAHAVIDLRIPPNTDAEALVGELEGNPPTDKLTGP